MAIRDKLQEYKEYIVIAGFAIGILYIFEILPITVQTLGLEDNVKFVYIGIIGLSVYTFHSFYWGYSSGPLNINRTVRSRSLSDPSHLARVAQQRSSGAPPVYQAPIQQQPVQEGQAQKNPSKKIWDTFNKE